jgi:hypothetical protein
MNKGNLDVFLIMRLLGFISILLYSQLSIENMLLDDFVLLEDISNQMLLMKKSLVKFRCISEKLQFFVHL